MPSALRPPLQLLLALAFAVLNVWLASVRREEEGDPWDVFADLLIVSVWFGAAAVLAGALVPRLARWVPLAAIAGVALVTVAKGDADGDRFAAWPAQLLVMQVFVLLGDRLRRRRWTAPVPATPPSRGLVVGAAVLAMAVPTALGSAWSVRNPPPDLDPCAYEVTTEQEAKVRKYRRGLAPALLVACAALTTAALALSRRLGGRRRPGHASLAGAAAVLAWAVAAILDTSLLEWLPGLTFVLILGVTVTVPVTIAAVMWTTTRSRTVRGPAAVLVLVWCSVLLTLGGVGATIVARGDDLWGLCMS